MINKEKGLTLVEVLLAIVIASLIAGIAYAVLFQGINTYYRVTNETKLRDEADIIMTNFMQVLYPLTVSDIQSVHFNEANSGNYYFTLNDQSKIGFIDGKIIISNRELKLTNGIELIPEKTLIIEVDQALYEIYLALKLTDKFSQSLELKSEILLIDDVNEVNG